MLESGGKLKNSRIRLEESLKETCTGNLNSVYAVVVVYFKNRFIIELPLQNLNILFHRELFILHFLSKAATSSDSVLGPHTSLLAGIFCNCDITCLKISVLISNEMQTSPLIAPAHIRVHQISFVVCNHNISYI